MRTVVIAMMIAVPTGTAFAQDFSLTTPPARPVTEDEVNKARSIDQGYRSALDKIPARQVQDPWGNVRGAGPPTDSQAKAPKKAK